MKGRPAFGEELYEQVLHECGYTCHYCGVHLFQNATVDHLIPRSRGGTDERFNLVAACRACNQLKADFLPEEFAIVQSVMKFAQSQCAELRRLLEAERTPDNVQHTLKRLFGLAGIYVAHS